MIFSDKELITVTDRALLKIEDLVGRGCYIRISISKKGCSGLSYKIDEVVDFSPLDELVEVGGLKICIDPAAIMFLLGSMMDVEEDELGWRFTFSNPNEKGRCGCGLSFFT